jgi:hypothetical protein
VLLSPSFLLANAVWFGAETSVYTIMGQRQFEQGFTSTRVALMHKSGRSLVWSLAVCSGPSSVRVQRAIHHPPQKGVFRKLPLAEAAAYCVISLSFLQRTRQAEES